MDFIQGLIGDVAEWLIHFFVHTVPPWLWEHKMWLIALTPLAGAYALYKYLWE